MKYNIYVKRSVANKAWETLDKNATDRGVHNPRVLLSRGNIFGTIDGARSLTYITEDIDKDRSQVLFTWKQVKQVIKSDDIQSMVYADAPIRPQDLRIVPRPDLED
ncbi:hypothetical protein PQ472_07880 [Lacticaseibacillus pabuli]|uniref:Uncharacterized protein n=1 Tax=Lacticaseibacillus pabuli TaxID=3025672 RepID=A0ABY7WQ08_9LACO|nr:hypothetical protein [Lacticaseibacillus sp. KACC 23028]WDF81844.1 hypothetical protein PQ472_07880 [Lacticaseibacillus sp. KACC 23028]